MTEKQQHCSNECACSRFAGSLAWRDSTPCMANHEGCKPCEWDTRLLPQNAITLTPSLAHHYTERSQATGKTISQLVLQDLAALHKKRVAREESRVFRENEFERL